jgi:hypothetical protein
MDWVSATYNKLEGLAVAADRFLGTVVGRCEEWVSGRKVDPSLDGKSRGGGTAGAAADRSAGRSGPLSA